MTNLPEEIQDELRACPFCGSEAAFGRVTYSRPVSDASWDDGSPITEAHCVNCIRCSGSNRNSISGGFRTQAKAAAAWNRRAGDAPRVDPDIEEARKLLELGGWIANEHCDWSDPEYSGGLALAAIKRGRELERASQ